MSSNTDNLRDSFIFLLGEKTFDELVRWYEKAVGGEEDFVVFVVRRSYILAQILANFSDIKMDSGSQKTFLTDSSIYRYCEVLEQKFRQNGRFPSILLCDDILIHGRNINAVIERMEKRLSELLADEYTEETVRYELSRAITIYVYTLNSAPLTILSRYVQLIRSERVEDARFWHKLSSDISTVIGWSNYANAVYVPNQVLTDAEYAELPIASKTTQTVFQNVTENGYVRLVENQEGRVKWAYSIRFLWFDNYNCNAIPFVFLPDLGREELDALTNGIRYKMLKDGYNDNAIKLFNSIIATEDIRGISELITYILSCTVLNHYCSIFESEDTDIYLKLARHMGVYTLNEKDVIGALKDLYKHPVFQGIEELELFLGNDKTGFNDSPISNDNYLFNYNPNAMDSARDDIRRRIENFFYIRGRESEHAVYNNRRTQRVFETDITHDNSELLRMVLDAICHDYNLKAVNIAFMYLMQMMDAGVFALSGKLPKDSSVSYCQGAKAGEQALLILPLRMNRYLPFISRMYDYCQIRQLDIAEHVESFFASSYGKEMIAESVGAPDSEINDNRVINFIENLRYMGQKPSDWDDNYAARLSFYKDGSFDDTLKYNSSREHCVELYEQFIN